MTAIWRQREGGYERMEPSGFPNEAELHELVSCTPELLPLAGAPDMVVLGDEVSLGTGYADVLAVERSGRFALIEVKLASNSEARRAVVAQLLSYASFLRGSTVESLEQGALAQELTKRGASTIAQLAASGFQDTEVDGDVFRSIMQASLDSGAFRLVWVLDQAPPELVSVVGYLESVSAGVVIDLVTVTQYQVGGERIIVPQRVDPGRVEQPAAPGGGATPPTPTTEGADDFVSSIDVSPEANRPLLRKLTDWAVSLQQAGLARLSTTSGKGRKMLKVCVVGEDVGLATICNEHGKGTIWLWRRVFERRAPDSIKPVEAAAGIELGDGRIPQKIDDALLGALRKAYEEAAGG